jgi:hypothetical protein
MRASLSCFAIVWCAAFGASCGAADSTGLFTDDLGGSGQAGSGAIGGDAGSAGDAGAGGFGGFGGSGGTVPDDGGGFGGTGTFDAAGGGSGSGANCDYCADGDGDGHGDPNRRTTACDPGIGWVTVCDDCQDANPEVYPGSTTCNGAPYLGSDGITPSFDYDCSGTLSECMEVTKATGNCQPMGIGCSGSGYVGKAEAAADAGAGAAYCGSTSYRVCNRVAVIACTPSTETRAAVECR